MIETCLAATTGEHRALGEHDGSARTTSTETQTVALGGPRIWQRDRGASTTGSQENQTRFGKTFATQTGRTATGVVRAIESSLQRGQASSSSLPPSCRPLTTSPPAATPA
jgi:hypothetical protein